MSCAQFFIRIILPALKEGRKRRSIPSKTNRKRGLGMEKQVPVKRVKDLLSEVGMPRRIIRAPDRTYVLPTKEYLLGRFSRSLRAHLVRYGVLDYRSGVNDCDDFARYACAHAAMVHRRNDLKKRKPFLPSLLRKCGTRMTWSESTQRSSPYSDRGRLSD